MTEKFLLPEGTIITCPNPHCRAVVGRLKRNLKAGDKLNRRALDGPMVRFGERPRCLSCNHLWYFESNGNSDRALSRIHTILGWFPDETRIARDE